MLDSRNILTWRCNNLRFFFTAEKRKVGSRQQLNLHGMVLTFRFVVLLQFLTKTVCLHTCNRILTAVESRAPAEHLPSDFYFTDLFSIAFKILVADVREEPGHQRRAGQGCENGAYFRLFFFPPSDLCCRLRHVNATGCHCTLMGLGRVHFAFLTRCNTRFNLAPPQDHPYNFKSLVQVGLSPEGLQFW